jgi:hypothetical protein
MIGEHKGVATLLKAKYPFLQTFHCMAHRLELAVKNSVDTVNAVSHFKMFVGELYKVYSMSPKNQRELVVEAESLSVELLKIQRVFDVRWVFSSFVAVKAVLRDYAALVAHFTKCASSQTGGRASKERAKYRGLLTKMKSWFFLSETCMLKDALRCLKQLSLYLQSHEANILNAASHIDDTINKLQALKEVKLQAHNNQSSNNVTENDNDDDNDDDNCDDDAEGISDDGNDDEGDAIHSDGTGDSSFRVDAEFSTETMKSKRKFKGTVTTLSRFWDSFDNDGHYKHVKIEQKVGDGVKFENLKSQFLQSLCDNLRQRFPSSDLLEASASLQKSSWPADPLERALFGEKHVAGLCKQFGFTSDVAAETVGEYATYKKTDGVDLGPKLKYLISVLTVLPISSADCERGFSQMNLYHTSGRNRLLVTSVNDSLMIGINGPPLNAWNVQKYVVSWLKSGRHGALDKATGLPKKVEIINHSGSATLFM